MRFVYSSVLPRAMFPSRTLHRLKPIAASRSRVVWMILRCCSPREAWCCVLVGVFSSPPTSVWIAYVCLPRNFTRSRNGECPAEMQISLRPNSSKSPCASRMCRRQDKDLPRKLTSSHSKLCFYGKRKMRHSRCLRSASQYRCWSLSSLFVCMLCARVCPLSRSTFSHALSVLSLCSRWLKHS